MPADNKDKVTILKLRKQKQNNVKTVGVTAYDYPQALMADNAGVDWILVGDSLGMTTLGYKSTIPVTMDDMLRSARAVARGSSRAFTVGDLPYMSYQVSNEEAVRNAGDFIQAGMDAVKVEGCMVERVKAICDAGIMVMSHLGLTPHTRAKLGGYRVQGKTADQAKIILDQALRLQDAGCIAVTDRTCHPQLFQGVSARRCDNGHGFVFDFEGRGCRNSNPCDGRGAVSRPYRPRIGRDWGGPRGNRTIRPKAAINVDR